MLIETHGALAQVFDIAALVQVECLSFGLMDFVSAHNGAIPGRAAMGSPEQFEHPLIRRALAEISAACHAHGKVPSHNVSTDISTPTERRCCRPCPQRVRLSAQVEHPSGPVRANRFRIPPSHEEVTRAGRILRPRRTPPGVPSSIEGRLHDAQAIAIGGPCCNGRTPPAWRCRPTPCALLRVTCRERRISPWTTNTQASARSALPPSAGR